MGGDEREYTSGNQENVGDEKSRDGQSSHLGAAAHHAFETLADQWNLTGGVGSYRGCKIGALVPGKQVARKRHAQNEGEKQTTGKPEQFAPPLVSTVYIGLRE